MLVKRLWQSLSGLALVGVLSGCGATATVENSILPVETAQVMQGALDSLFSVTGEVKAKQQVELSPKLPGRVEEVLVDVGDVVSQGDVLLRMDTHEIEAQLAQARAGVDAARARLAEAESGSRAQVLEQAEQAVRQAQSNRDLAQATYDRTKQLFDSGAVPQQELDAAKQRLDAADAALHTAQAQLSLSREGASKETLASLRAQVKQAEAAVLVVQANLANAVLTAPISGTVSERNVEVGEMVSAAPVLTLVVLDPAVVQVNIPEENINGVEKGQKLQVRIPALENAEFAGVVSEISIHADPESKSYPVKVELTNGDGRLKVGMLAEVLVSQERPTSLLVPSDAVVVEPGAGSSVYVVQGDQAEKRGVRTGLSANGLTEVLEGLTEGEQVVVKGTELLREWGTQGPIQVEVSSAQDESAADGVNDNASAEAEAGN